MPILALLCCCQSPSLPSDPNRMSPEDIQVLGRPSSRWQWVGGISGDEAIMSFLLHFRYMYPNETGISCMGLVAKTQIWALKKDAPRLTPEIEKVAQTCHVHVWTDPNHPDPPPPTPKKSDPQTLGWLSGAWNEEIAKKPAVSASNTVNNQAGWPITIMWTFGPGNRFTYEQKMRHSDGSVNDVLSKGVCVANGNYFATRETAVSLLSDPNGKEDPDPNLKEYRLTRLDQDHLLIEFRLPQDVPIPKEFLQIHWRLTRVKK